VSDVVWCSPVALEKIFWTFIIVGLGVFDQSGTLSVVRCDSWTARYINCYWRLLQQLTWDVGLCSAVADMNYVIARRVRRGVAGYKLYYCDSLIHGKYLWLHQHIPILGSEMRGGPCNCTPACTWTRVGTRVPVTSIGKYTAYCIICIIESWFWRSGMQGGAEWNLADVLKGAWYWCCAVLPMTQHKNLCSAGSRYAVHSYYYNLHTLCLLAIFLSIWTWARDKVLLLRDRYLPVLWKDFEFGWRLEMSSKACTIYLLLHIGLGSGVWRLPFSVKRRRE